MDKCKYDWPAAGERSLIGKRVKRIDGPAKASGRAKYTYDINRPGMLTSKIYRSPYAHARITAIDTSEAEKLSGGKDDPNRFWGWAKKPTGWVMKFSPWLRPVRTLPTMPSARSKWNSKSFPTSSWRRT